MSATLAFLFMVSNTHSFHIVHIKFTIRQRSLIAT
jgi:hypothetical protein